MRMSLLHRREGIVISTIEALNEVGLHNLSTKIIAKKEGVSEGTLFRHFKNKTEIMLAVLERFGQYDDAIIEASINKKLNPIETIRYLVAEYSEYYENYPAITSIVQLYDSLMYDHELSHKLRIILMKRFNFILQTIKEAQKQGLIKPDIDSEKLTDLILAAIRDTCLKWRMDEHKFSLKDRIISIVDMLLDAFIIN